MDSDAIQELARRCTREQFCMRFSSWFLAVKVDAQTDDEEKIGFETAVVDYRDDKLKRSENEWEVLELAKARGNPYPDRISIGRARNCDVVMRDPSVSKLHAHFRSRTGGWELVDLGSANGTRVDGAPLAPNQAHPVQSGAQVEFGTVACKLVDAGALYDLLQFGA